VQQCTQQSRTNGRGLTLWYGMENLEFLYELYVELITYLRIVLLDVPYVVNLVSVLGWVLFLIKKVSW